MDADELMDADDDLYINKLMDADDDFCTMVDHHYCQLFLFSNAKIKNSIIEYFEIRDKFGKLIINKKEIKKCYSEFKLI